MGAPLKAPLKDVFVVCSNSYSHTQVSLALPKTDEVSVAAPSPLVFGDLL